MPATPRMRRISDMRVAELRTELEKRNLETKGLKGALIQRLQQAMNNEEMENTNNSFEKNKQEIISELQSSTGSDDKSVSDIENTEPTEVIGKESDKETNQTVETEIEEVTATEQENSIPTPEVTEKSKESDESQVEQAQENLEIPDDSEQPKNDEAQNEEECIEAVEENAEEEIAKDDHCTEEEVIHPGESGDELDASDQEQNDAEEVAIENDGNVSDSEFLKEEEPVVEDVIDEDVASTEQIQSEEQDEINLDKEVEDENLDLENSSIHEPDVVEESNLSEDERFYSFADDVTNQEECGEEEVNEEYDQEEEEEVVEEVSEITEEYVAYVTVDDNEQPEEIFAEEEVISGDQTPDLEEDEARYEDTPKTDPAPEDVESEEIQHNIEEDTGAMEVGEQQKDEDDEEDAVAIEEDVLDMLDYDIEMPDNQHGKSDSKEKSEESNKAKERNLAAKKIQQKSVSNDGIRKSPPESSSAAEKPAKKGSLSETKNLWISGLSSSTRASELKVAFSRYGKVVGAKVVTNAKSPGSKCFGFVAMSTADAANKCILHLNRTEMHGHYITVERTRTDPSASKKSTTAAAKTVAKDSNKESEANKQDNTETKGSADNKDRDSPKRRNTSKDRGSKQSSKDREDPRNEANRKTDIRRRTQYVRSYRRKTDNRPSPRTGLQAGDKRGNESQVGVTSRRSSVGEPIRKRPRNPDGRREVVIDNKAGELSLRVNVSSSRNRPMAGNSSVMTRLKRTPPPRERISRVAGDSDRPARVNMIPQTNFRRRGTGMQRQNMGIARPNTNMARQGVNQYRTNSTFRQNHSIAESHLMRSRKPDQRLNHRGNGDTFNRGEGIRSARGLSPPMDRGRPFMRKEREQRELLQLEREKLERERRQLEKDRQERERLERERLKLEQERKLELEKIGKAKDEMRRLQEINRYEQAQRQRAIKRTYDAVSTATRRTQGSSDRREDRDDRRSGYQYATRDRGSDSPQVRNEQESYRGGRISERSTQPSLLTRGSSKSVLSQNYHDTDRRRDVIPSRDTDARYGNDKKFERTERNTDYDRRSGPTNVSSFSRDGREGRAMDDRKVISRERQSRNSRSPVYRRPNNNSTSARKEATFSNTSSSAIRRRPTDRDMREDTESRNVSAYESGRKSERSGRKMGEQRDARNHSNPGSSSRSGLQKYRSESDGRSGDVNYSSKRSPAGAAVSGKPIPTTARTQPDPWSSWQQQQPPPRSGNNTIWTGGNSVPAPPLGVPPPLVGFGGVPPNEHAHIQGLPAGLSLLPPHGAYFAPNRPTTDNRYDGYKNIRRF